MNKFLLILLINPLFLIGQNLVINPDFQKTSDTISEIIDNIKGLRGFGTVDFFYPSSEKFFPWHVPPNTYLGYAYPKCGDGFGGFFYFSYTDVMGNKSPYFEHIQFALNDTLQKNKNYEIIFYIKLANKQCAGNNLEVV